MIFDSFDDVDSLRDLLRGLYDLRCHCPSISGRERSFLAALEGILEAGGFLCEFDSAGNLLIRWESGGPVSLVLDAHVDAVGCVLTGLDAQARWRFEGIVPANELVDAEVRVSRRAGGAYLGLCRSASDTSISERDISKLYFEPATTPDVQPASGDVFVWNDPLVEASDGTVLGHGLDNLVGVTVALHALRRARASGIPGCAVALTVQEEIGFRGMAGLLAELAPPRLIVIDAVSAVLEDRANEVAGPRLGNGAVLSRSPASDPTLFAVAEGAFQLAGAGSMVNDTFYPEPTNAAVVMPTRPSSRVVSLGFPLEGKHGRRERVLWSDVEALSCGLDALVLRILEATDG